MDFIALISRWAHVMAVIVLVGGTLFMRLALAPATASGSVAADARDAIRKQWAKWVGIATLFLLVSGFYNAFLKAKGYHLDGIYLTLLTIKIVVGFAVFFMTAVINGRSDRAVRWRERETHWLNIICALMLVLVLSAGYMKMSSPKPKTPDSTSTAGSLDTTNSSSVDSSATEN